MWKWLLAGLLFAVPAQAAVQVYALQCSAPCVASDGTTQPAGTILPGMLTRWDGVTPWTPPPGFTAVVYTGQGIYQPTVAAPNIITGYLLWKRLTTAEQNALIGKGASFTNIALLYIANPSVSVTDPQTISDFAALVTAGVLTSQRRDQILNLAVSLP